MTKRAGQKLVRAGAAILLTMLLLGTVVACGSEEAIETEHPADPGAEDNAPGFYEVAQDDTILCLIEDLDIGTGVLTFNQVEWLTLEDTERIEEIGLDPDDDMPGGFYIYNESDQLYRINTAEDVTVYLLDWDDLANPIETDLASLAERLEGYESPYRLTVEDEAVVSITEVYTP